MILTTTVLFSLSVAVCHVGIAAGYYETHFTEPEAHHNSRNALHLSAYKWPRGIVPYQFNNSCNQQYRSTVLDAMNVLHQATCVHFIPKTDEQVEHIEFGKSDLGCGSSIGYRPKQTEPLAVLLDDFCLGLPGAVQHELLHVLGLFHEHTRPDRDDYVEVLWDNIEPEFKQNFFKGSWDYMETFGLPYDFGSVMHYPTYAFARSGTMETMISRQNRSAELGQTDGASPLDLEKVRRMYEC